MQTNGDFVLYDNEKNSKWSLKTSTTVGPHLTIQDDGNLVLYDANKKALWNSLTHAPCTG